MTKTVKILTLQACTTKDNSKKYWKLSVTIDGKAMNALCFDAKIADEKQGVDLQMDVAEKGDTTFINYPKSAGGEKKTYGAGRSFAKSPEEQHQQATLMTLAYAKDLVVAFLPKKVAGAPYNDEDMDWLLKNLDKAHSHLMGMVFKQAEAPKEKETTNELDTLINDNIKGCIDRMMTQGWIIDSHAADLAVSILGGNKVGEAFVRATVPLSEMTDNDKKIVADRSVSFHAACQGMYSTCPYAVTDGKCKWVGECWFYKNSDPRRGVK